MHPRDILVGAQAATGFLPVCDHYSGVEARMRKSLALQAELTEEFGACVFDVTLDCEDGAPVGGEVDHAEMVADLVKEAMGKTRSGGQPAARIAVRVHPVDHPAFETDMQIVLPGAGSVLCHLMIPKVESAADLDRVVGVMDQLSSDPAARALPLHALVESAGAVHRAFDIAAHPRVQSVSFGLLDFVSSHGGAIPLHGMSGKGQFTHPLVVRAKLEIASACHANAKVPSHCVVTEFRDLGALTAAAKIAAGDMGYTRMWSIHPGQIRPILEAFAPVQRDIETAAEIITRARQADWAPIDFGGQLHDRASYRYFWHILERAQRTGRVMPAAVRDYFVPVLP